MQIHLTNNNYQDPYSLFLSFLILSFELQFLLVISRDSRESC